MELRIGKKKARGEILMNTDKSMSKKRPLLAHLAALRRMTLEMTMRMMTSKTKSSHSLLIFESKGK